VVNILLASGTAFLAETYARQNRYAPLMCWLPLILFIAATAFPNATPVHKKPMQYMEALPEHHKFFPALLIFSLYFLAP